MTLRKAAHRTAGLTLIELLVSMSIVVILVAVAAPSMYEFVMRKRVQGVADELLGDLRFARSVQTRDNRETAVMFGKTQTDTCYTVYQPTSRLTCDCTATPVCDARGSASAIELKTVRIPASSHVTVEPSSGTVPELRWTTITGLAKDGATLSIEIQAPSGGEVRVSTSATGRAQICSVSGHGAAYPACPTTTTSP